MQQNAKVTKQDWLEIALLLAPFLFLALQWDKFPHCIPIHWDLHGKINGWSSKPFGLLMLPVTNVLAWLLLRFIHRIDPKVRCAGEEEQMRAIAALRVVRFTMLLFIFGIFCIQVANARGYPIPMDSFAYNGCLLVFIVIGNYFGTLRPNYFIGIRTPWTLENPETWRATHRAGGRIMVFGALLLIFSEFFIQRQIFAWLFMTFILGFALWACVYSWNYSRTHAQAR